MLRKNNHYNSELQSEWCLYGEENFEFVILKVCNDEHTQDDIDNFEELYIKKYKDAHLSYNVANSKNDYSNFVTDESRRLTGELNRKRLTGSTLSDEVKSKMSQSRKRYLNSMSDDEYEEYKRNFVKNVSDKVSKPWSDSRKEAYSRSQWEKPHSAKLTVSQVREIRRLYEVDNKSITDISKMLNIKYSTVSGIVHYKRWAHVK